MFNESEQNHGAQMYGGINVGIQSAGTQITTGVYGLTSGTGNTVQYDYIRPLVSIAGGGVDLALRLI